MTDKGYSYVRFSATKQKKGTSFQRQTKERRPCYQTWVWWVSGIVLGAAILTLFAVFEKRRNDVLHLLEEIKSWD